MFMFRIAGDLNWLFSRAALTNACSESPEWICDHGMCVRDFILKEVKVENTSRKYNINIDYIIGLLLYSYYNIIKLYFRLN